MANREQFIQNFVQTGKAKGATPQEVSAKLKLALPEYDAKFSMNKPVTLPKPPEQSGLRGFGENIVKSGVNAVSGIAEAGVNAFNPNLEKNTVANLARIPLGVGGYIADKGYEAVTGTPVRTNFLGSQDVVDNVAKSYKDRYGGTENIKKTLYEDPVGVALDASMVLGAGGSLASGVGGASKSATLSKIGSGLTKAGEVVDPIRGAGTFIKKGKNAVASGLEKASDRYITSGIGNPAKQVAISDKAGRSVAEIMKEYNLYDRSPETIGAKMSEVGSKYDDISLKSGKSINVSELLGPMYEKLVEIEKNGGKYSKSAQAMRDEIQLRLAQSIDNIKRPETGRIPETISIPDVTTFRKNAIDPDIPQSAFGLDPKMSGTVSGTKTVRDIYRKALNEAEPELKKLGLDYGALKELKKVFKSSESRANNRQVLGLNKIGSSGVGAVLGGLPGAIAAAAGTGVLQNPKVIEILTKAMDKSATFIKKPKPKTSKVFSKGYQASKVGSRVKESK